MQGAPRPSMTFSCLYRCSDRNSKNYISAYIRFCTIYKERRALRCLRSVYIYIQSHTGAPQMTVQYSCHRQVLRGGPASINQSTEWQVPCALALEALHVAAGRPKRGLAVRIHTIDYPYSTQVPIEREHRSWRDWGQSPPPQMCMCVGVDTIVPARLSLARCGICGSTGTRALAPSLPIPLATTPGSHPSSHVSPSIRLSSTHQQSGLSHTVDVEQSQVGQPRQNVRQCLCSLCTQEVDYMKHTPFIHPPRLGSRAMN